MMKYENYKPSGIEWLGEIPEHWEVNNLKRLCSLIKDGTHGSFRRVDFGFPLLSVRNIVNSCFVLLEDDSHISKEDYVTITNSFKIRENDIQLAIVGATMGKVAKVPKLEPFATQRSLSTIRTNNKLLITDYLFYFIQSSKFQSFLWANTSYSAQPGIYLGTIQNIGIPLPTISEQTAIAQYLDYKTQTIDQKIDILTRKISLYKNLRKGIINNAVCRGIDKNIKLKDSDLDFQVPENWNIYRLKDLGYLYSGLSGKSGDDFNQDENPNNKGFIPFTNIANNTYLKKDHLGTVNISDNENQNKVKKGDIFFLMSSEGYEDIGKTALLADDLEETYLNSFCKGYRINNKNGNSTFLNYLLLSDNYRKLLIVEGKGFTRINLKMEKVTDFTVYLPPTKEEQIKIAEYLDQKTQKIDCILYNIQKQIATLKELRKSLINDVVTGKIKVIV